ncbi:hypothetical protein QYS49_35670 [Marivirga salinae]|uniref:Uncharacterized protein n=1 Tax=Marivirga salinarum TaxID=3059078 RepID=A0AA51RBM8_9BACT|nr:hypothetical protein [Marivirga sp. BDSF4-3]WMN10683.1 hypothetical protein QYS49_35670 [Marivirga sp. BDSF4-3]
MKIVRLALIIAISYSFVFSSEAQFRRRSENKTVTYEEMYNDPYDINKLFIGITPAYGDIHVTNITTGFGVDATYYLNDFMHFKAHARTPYFIGSDFARNSADKNGADSQSRFRTFFFAEASASYHIWDKEQESQSKIPLYSKNYEGAEWAAKVPQRADIPNKRREILFARLGGVYYQTTSELSRAIAAQDVTVNPVGATEETANSLSGESEEAVFGNVLGAGVSVGGGFTWIKNFAAKPDKTYEELVDDHVFSTFMDLFIFPMVIAQNFYHKPAGATDFIHYNASTINTFKFGGRIGIDGHFNRTLGWGYGAEIGLRPGLAKRGFYGMLKITFPMYGTKLDYSVEAFGR